MQENNFEKRIQEQMEELKLRPSEAVWEKVEEEIGELKTAIGAADPVKSEEELGDVLFSLVNYARFLQVDADNALELTNKKFIHRFTQMEQKAMQHGRDLSTMTLQEMDAIWNTIKQQRST